MRPIVTRLLGALAALVLATPILAATSSVVTLDRLWSRGGDDDPDVMFGMPVGVVADPEGNVSVLDNQLSQIVALSPAGDLRGVLGREGSGPGEFRRPNGLVVLPDGAIAAAQLVRGRFERLTPDGIPDGSFTLGGDGAQEGVVVLYGAACRGGTLLAGTAASAFDEGTGVMRRVQSLGTYHPDGRPRAALREVAFDMVFTGAGAFHERELLRCFLLVHAVGPDGRVYVPRSRDEYVIDVYHPDGRLERTVERPDFIAPPRTDRERARLAALSDTWRRNSGLDLDVHFEKTEMAVGHLFVDDRNHLFVRHAASGRDLPAGVFLRLDEFDPAGRRLGEVLVRAPADPAMDTLAWLGDDRVAILRGGVLAGLERWRDAAVYWQDEEEVAPEVVVCAWTR